VSDESRRIPLDDGREIRIEPLERESSDDPQNRITLIEADGREFELETVTTGLGGPRSVTFKYAE
jgi:hypothetical protein